MKQLIVVPASGRPTKAEVKRAAEMSRHLNALLELDAGLLGPDEWRGVKLKDGVVVPMTVAEVQARLAAASPQHFGAETPGRTSGSEH